MIKISREDFENEIKRIRSISFQSINYAQIYKKLYKFLGLPEAAINIAIGNAKFPYRTAPLGKVFPPALLPLWSTGAGTTVGYWKHWFTSHRSLTLVEHYGTTIYGSRRMVFEYARNFEQLIYISLYYDVIDDGGINKKYLDFLENIGVSEIENFEELAVTGNGDLDELLKHSAFKKNPPLRCLEKQNNYDIYAGDFPYEGMKLSELTLRNCCEYEIHSGFNRDMEPDYFFRKKVAETKFAPPWFKTEEKVRLFYKLIDEEDFLGSWMTLNSCGWKIKDAQEAIMYLSQKAEDPLFSILAEIWSKLPYSDPSEEY